MNRIFRSSLRSRLLLLILLAVLPTLALTVEEQLAARRQATQEALDETIRVAELAAAQQERLVDSARQLLIALALIPAVRDRDRSSCNALFGDLVQKFPRYANLGVAELDGEVVCSGLPIGQKTSIGDRSYFRGALRTGTFALGEYQIGRITRKPGVNVGYPVRGRDGRVRGVVFVAIDLAWLNQLAANARLPRGAVVTVVDRGGLVLVRHPDQGKWVGRAMPEAPIVKTMVAQSAGTAEAGGVDGVPRIYAFTPMDASGANSPVVAVGLPRSVVYAEANRQLLIHFGLLTLVALLAFGATWVGADRLVLRQVDALLGATRRLRTGDLGARTGLAHVDGELGLLARAFDEMAQTLERRQHEAEAAQGQLHENEERFRSLFEGVPVGLYRTTPEGRFLHVNPAMVQILGYPDRETLLRTNAAALYVDIADRRGWQEVVEREGVVEKELRLRRFDGTAVWVADRSRVIRDARDRVTFYEGSMQDITTRMQADHAMRSLNTQLEQRVVERTAELIEAKAFLEHLIAASPSVIFRATPDWGRVTYVSPNVERVLGYTPQEVISAPRFWWNHIHPADRERVMTAGSWPPAERPAQVELEYRFQHKDGTYRWLYALAYFEYDQASGLPVSIFGYGLDLTERKVAEQTIEEARTDAERANQAKSEFLSRMSHELRTPLNAILGFAQLLEMDSLSPDQREGVEHILRGGEHLLKLVNDVLDIARIESGRLRLSLEPVSVGDVLNEALDLVRPLAGQRNVALGDGLEAAEDRFVLADHQRLKQVLLNLLSNAIKYNRNGGSVTVTCEEAPEQRASIKISDTGPGIAPEKFGQLFVPFARLGAEQSSVEGTGIGLALSKGLVELMGGNIGADSVVGRGSTFWVELPQVESPVANYERMAAAAAVAPIEPTPAGGPITVLYIENNLANLDLIQRLLGSRPDVRLLTAIQGRMGLELARQHRPDLILLDLNLPDLPGEEVLRRLQVDLQGSRTPVVVISAESTPGQAERLVALGARAFLTKPLDVRQFLALLNETVSARPGVR